MLFIWVLTYAGLSVIIYGLVENSCLNPFVFALTAAMLYGYDEAGGLVQFSTFLGPCSSSGVHQRAG